VGAPEHSLREVRNLGNPSSTSELCGIGLLQTGLGLRGNPRDGTGPQQVLQLDSMEFGLLGNSEELLWHQDVGGVKVRLSNNARDWLSK
jgi:hypothetical protein